MLFNGDSGKNQLKNSIKNKKKREREGKGREGKGREGKEKEGKRKGKREGKEEKRYSSLENKIGLQMLIYRK